MKSQFLGHLPKVTTAAILNMPGLAKLGCRLWVTGQEFLFGEARKGPYFPFPRFCVSDFGWWLATGMVFLPIFDSANCRNQPRDAVHSVCNAMEINLVTTSALTAIRRCDAGNGEASHE